MNTISLQQWIDAAPDKIKPWIAQYGAGILTRAEDQIQQTFNLMLAGDMAAPMRLALSAMSEDQLDQEGQAFTATDDQHTQQNADDVASQKKAAEAAAAIAFSILSGLVVL